jgi:hypothetical protein
MSIPSRDEPLAISRCGRLAAIVSAVILGCGGTTGREGLDTPFGSDDAGVHLPNADAGNAGIDATLNDDPDAGWGDDASESFDGLVPADDAAQRDSAADAQACCTVTPQCNACLQTNCAPPNGSSIVPPCSGGSGVQGVATGGPAAGSARVDLCKEVWACVTRAKCGVSTVSECYCGTASGATCLNPGAANGACKDTIERGLETTDPVAIATGFTNMDVGGGVALQLYGCIQENCWDDCIANRSSDAGARDGQ